MPTTRSGGARQTISRTKPTSATAKSGGSSNRCGPDRVVERGAEHADHGPVHPSHHGLGDRSLSEQSRRQRAEQHQHAGQEDTDQAESTARPAARETGISTPPDGAAVGDSAAASITRIRQFIESDFCPATWRRQSYAVTCVGSGNTA